MHFCFFILFKNGSVFRDDFCCGGARSGLPNADHRRDAALQFRNVRDDTDDAPALAGADVGIAIGAGTDVAIESADIVLMKSDLMDAVTAVELSKQVIRNIKQNLFWAFIYNIIGIPLAAGVWYPLFHIQLSPMFAAAAMSLSSVCVVSNALRLKRFKPTAAAPAAAREPIHTNGGIRIMEKKMVIEGMMCAHCQARVEQALNALPGVAAQVDLQAKPPRSPERPTTRR